MSDRCSVLKTLMSCPLTSSRASTTTRCSFRRSIASGVEVMRPNIVEHRGGYEAGEGAVGVRGAGGEEAPHLGGGSLDRRHAEFDDAAGGAVREFGRSAVAGTEERGERRAGPGGDAGAPRHGEVHEVGDGLPLAPGVEPLE